MRSMRRGEDRFSYSAAREATCRLRGVARLAAACLLIFSIWTLLLPQLGTHAPLRESIDRRDALGINAEAMFYTELEAMKTLRVKWTVRQ